jgi:hypothetical protein
MKTDQNTSTEYVKTLYLNNYKHVQFGILTAVTMKSSVFWDITSCSPLKVHRRFGGICRLPLHSSRVSKERNQHVAGSKHVAWQRRLTFNVLYGVISQKIELFIVTAVRTYNPTYSTVFFCYQHTPFSRKKKPTAYMPSKKCKFCFAVLFTLYLKHVRVGHHQMTYIVTSSLGSSCSSSSAFTD